MSLPTNLYAYTDQNPPSVNLYGWTNENENITFWTTTDNPTLSTRIYDNLGNDVTDDYLDGQDARINLFSASEIQLAYGDVGFHLPISDIPNQTGIYVYVRDSSKDTTYNTKPGTVYTDNTNLSVGQMLYTNEGVDSGFVIDTLNQDGSFTITEESE